MSIMPFKIALLSYFDNNLQKILRTNLLDSGTGQVRLIIVLMVGLCLDN